MKSIDLKQKLDFGALIKKYAVASIIFAIVAIAIGALFIAAPLASTSVVIWIALGLIALFGLVAVIRFIFPGKGNERDGFAFTFGLLVIAIFVILLVCACCCPDLKVVVDQQTLVGFQAFTFYLVRFFGIFFGVVACFGSVWSLCMIGSVEKGKKGWVIFGDILSLVLGVLMIVFPIAYWFVAGIIVGVYIIIIAIFAIVVASKAIHYANKAKKELKNNVVEQEEKK